MVPGEGFEPPTFGLQNRCTTTVLTRQANGVYHASARMEALIQAADNHAVMGVSRWSRPIGASTAAPGDRIIRPGPLPGRQPARQ